MPDPTPDILWEELTVRSQGQGLVVCRLGCLWLVQWSSIASGQLIKELPSKTLEWCIFSSAKTFKISPYWEPQKNDSHKYFLGDPERAEIIYFWLGWISSYFQPSRSSITFSATLVSLLPASDFYIPVLERVGRGGRFYATAQKALQFKLAVVRPRISPPATSKTLNVETSQSLTFDFRSRAPDPQFWWRKSVSDM